VAVIAVCSSPQRILQPKAQPPAGRFRFKRCLRRSPADCGAWRASDITGRRPAEMRSHRPTSRTQSPSEREGLHPPRRPVRRRACRHRGLADGSQRLALARRSVETDTALGKRSRLRTGVAVQQASALATLLPFSRQAQQARETPPLLSRPSGDTPPPRPDGCGPREAAALATSVAERAGLDAAWLDSTPSARRTNVSPRHSLRPRRGERAQAREGVGALAQPRQRTLAGALRRGSTASREPARRDRQGPRSSG